MPLQWTISHPTRLVVAVATGELRPEDIESYFDAVARENASPYRKLFDASQATARLSDDQLIALGARIRAYMALGPIGPVAIVAPTVESHEQASIFAALAEADRPLRIFRERHLAQQWLDAQPEPKPAG
jgi:hypothetical protein